MKRWLKRIGICVAVLIPLVLLVLVERMHGRAALDRLLAQIKARDGEVSVSRLAPAVPQRDQNGFYDLANLTNHSWRILQSGIARPSFLGFAAPGRAVTMAQIHEWSSDQKTISTWDNVRSMVDEAEDMYDSIHAALGKPGYVNPMDYHHGFEIPFTDAQHSKRLYEALALAVACELDRERPQAANERLLDLLKLVAAQKTERLILCQLVRFSGANLAFDATWQALQIPGWTEAQLAAWQTAWSEFEPTRDLETALEMERAINHEYMGERKSSRAKLVAVLETQEKAFETAGIPSSYPTHGFMLTGVHARLWRMAWADQDEFNLLAKWTTAIDRAHIAFTNSWAALPADSNTDEDTDFMGSSTGETPKTKLYDRMRFLFSNSMPAVGDKTVFKAIHLQIQQRLAVTALAIARYRLKYGKAPESLPALVPEFLPAVPLDPIDGKALRYRPLPDGNFTLYSVGADGKDDGGDPALVAQREHFEYIWDGKDVVWPMAATDGEAAAAWAVEKKKLRR